jgi:TRAP-type transport system periplasmic protein
MRYKTVGLFLVTALLAAATFMGQATAKMVLKAGHVLSATSDQGLAIAHFAKRVSELTKGEIEIQVFPDGQLGKSDPAQLESVISGAQDFFVSSIEWYQSWDDRFGIMTTPFVFRDRTHFQHFLRSDLFKDMSESIEKAGMKFLSTDFGWMRMQDRGVLAKRPVRTPADLAGMKFRMFQSEMPIKSWAGLGANIVVMPFSDVYTALATGTVEGLTGPIGALYATKLTEQAKYFTPVREYFQCVVPVISMRTWRRLSPAHQTALMQASNESASFFVEASTKERDDFTQRAMKENGLEILEVPLGPWHEKMKSVLSEFEASGVLPKGLAQQVQAIQ